VLSWALMGGGARYADSVVWVEVRDRELDLTTDAAALLAERLAAAQQLHAVGLLTSAPLAEVVQREFVVDGLQGGCVATVGLSNALRAGDPASPLVNSTINALVWVDRPLSRLALIEALALASEARTAAMLERPVPSTVSGEPATGTGTDCLVVACPNARRRLPYAGKHTQVGQVVGSAVLATLRAGITSWLARIAPGSR
jgi:adenosylcobinamide amidohydrolase